MFKKIFKKKKVILPLVIIICVFLFVHFFMSGGLTALGYKII